MVDVGLSVRRLDRTLRLLTLQGGAHVFTFQIAVGVLTDLPRLDRHEVTTTDIPVLLLLLRLCHGPIYPIRDSVGLIIELDNKCFGLSRPIHRHVPISKPRREIIAPVLPAFMAYEKALVGFLKRGLFVPRDDSVHEVRVEYAGGEKAEQAIRALREKISNNDRAKNNLVTIKLADVEYNNERYCPPENHWNIIGNSAGRKTSTRAARVSKGAPYRLSYECSVYVLYEEDLRYVMNTTLLKWHHHGGVAYLGEKVFETPHPGLIPMFLRGYSHNVNSETGEEERSVRATFLIEMEAYLPLPLVYINVFKRYIQDIVVGIPGDLDSVDVETTLTTEDELDLNHPGPANPAFAGQ